MFLQIFVTLTNLGRQFIEIFLCLDRTAKEQFALWILGREQFLTVYCFQFHLAFIIGENDLSLTNIDLGGLKSAVIPAPNADFVARATGFVTRPDRKSTRLNSCHVEISYAVFCLKKKRRRTQSCCDSHRSLLPIGWGGARRR